MSESNPSLVILAVKNAMLGGAGKYSQTQRFDSFYSASEVERSLFDIDSANDFIDVVIDQIDGDLSGTLGDEKEIIRSNLEMIREFNLLEDGDQSGTSINQFYDKNDGKFASYFYLFKPSHGQVSAESLTLSFKIRLPNEVKILYHSKKILFWTKKWEEKVYLPPSISSKTIIDCLSISFAPFLYTQDILPSDIIADLIEQAKETNFVIPSDDDRRTVYDPVKKMNVVVSDPEVLKLIPARWITHSGTFVSKQTNYEFA